MRSLKGPVGRADRKVYAEVPPRVEYRMTEPARTIMPILFALDERFEDHAAKLEAQARRRKSKGAQQGWNWLPTISIVFSGPCAPAVGSRSSAMA
jgi:hypothetical protein